MGQESCEKQHIRTMVAVLFVLVFIGLRPIPPWAEPLVRAVGPIEITVADMARSVAFYVDVLHFKTISDVEVHGPEYERLQGVFGLRMRKVRLQLGQEMVVLTEYLAPQGRQKP